jgi:hypothetical protein
MLVRASIRECTQSPWVERPAPMPWAGIAQAVRTC